MKPGSFPASLEKVLHQKEGIYQEEKDPGKGRSNIRQGKLEDEVQGSLRMATVQQV